MLCSACESIRTGRDEPWYHFPENGQSLPAYRHHPTPAVLEQASDGGCHICEIIWRKLTSEERDALKRPSRSPYLDYLSQWCPNLLTNSSTHYSWSPIDWYGESDGARIRFQFGHAPFWKQIVFLLLPPTLDLETASQDRKGRLFKALSSKRPDGPISDMVMWDSSVQELVQKWKNDCRESHDECNQSHQGSESQAQEDWVHPSRMLDLRDDRIRLDTDPEKRRSRPYATLTHKWPEDSSTMPMLNDQNMEEWQEQGIEMEALTATFRDAVRVARQLGMEYLWIDSLCIQQRGQGSQKDWESESGKMGEVYRHASLNIQAGRDANKWNSSLFITHSAEAVKPYLLRISRTVHQAERVGRHRPSDDELPLDCDFLIIEEDFARDAFLSNPINHRGWVLQERVLSHRILHFGPQQVFWECRELLACETFPNGIPDIIPRNLPRTDTTVLTASLDRHDTISRSLSFRVKQRMRSSFRAPSLPSGRHSRHTSLHRELFAWLYLIELYSACSLTYTTDKLVAISGLAKIFGSPDLQQKAGDIVKYLGTLALPRCSHGVASGLKVSDISEAVSRYSAPLGLKERGDYLAGLWRSELIPCLLWHVANGQKADNKPTQRLNGHPAPTWSWASIDGLINASIYQKFRHGKKDRNLVTAESACTVPLSETLPWGQVRDGWIQIRGRVIRNVPWPDLDEMDALAKGEDMRRHKTELMVHMVSKIRRNVPSVARLSVLKADVRCYVDVAEEFVNEVKHSANYGYIVSPKYDYEVALLPLVGFEQEEATWTRPAGEICEWHGLIIKLQRNQALRLGYFKVTDSRLFEIKHRISRKIDLTLY